LHSEGPNGLESYNTRIRNPGNNAVLMAQPICSKHNKVVFSLERDLDAKIGRARITRSSVSVSFAATWATYDLLAEGLDPLVAWSEP
jgi:hypothetical protein